VLGLRLGYRVRVRFSVSVSLNKSNSGAGELTDKYTHSRGASLGKNCFEFSLLKRRILQGRITQVGLCHGIGPPRQKGPRDQRAINRTREKMTSLG